MTAQRRPHVPRVASHGVGVLALALLPVLGGCGGDDAPPVATLESDFPGDAFDAACELLERSELDDQVATVEAVLDSLADQGDEATAINTLELAVADRCPDWQDALDEALADRS